MAIGKKYRLELTNKIAYNSCSSCWFCYKQCPRNINVDLICLHKGYFHLVEVKE